MMRFLPFVLALSSAFSLAGLQAAETDDALKARVVALARTVTPNDFAFTRTARVEQTTGDKTETRVMIEKFDPRKPADQRWALVTVDGRAPTAEQLEAHRKESPKRRVTHYGRVADYFGAPSITTASSGRTVFRFNSLPKESLVLNDSDLSSSAIADATVDTGGAAPFVEQVRFTLTKPTRLKLVAKVEKMEATTRYRIMPEGIPAPVEQISDMHGSMLGKTGRIRTVLTYSEHSRVR
jgi:hypothetical protein